MLSLYYTHHHSSVHTLTQSPLEMRSAFRSSFIFLEFFLSLSRTYLNESSRNPVSELKFIMFVKMARSGTKISQNLALFTISCHFFFGTQAHPHPIQYLSNSNFEKKNDFDTNQRPLQTSQFEHGEESCKVCIGNST